MTFLSSLATAAAGPLISGVFGAANASRNSSAVSSANAVNANTAQQGLDLANMQLQVAQSNREVDYARQKEFAMNSSGWAFDDLMEAADEAGIHRLAALGSASASQYSGGTTLPGIPSGGAGAIADVRQDHLGDAVGEAVDRLLKKEDPAEKRADKVADAQVDLLEAEAELARSQSRTSIAAARNATTSGPAAKGQQDFEAEDLVQKIRMPDGSIQDVVVGPGVDEIAAGGAIYVFNKVKKLWEPKREPKKSKRPGASDRPKPVYPTARSSGSISRR